MRSFSTRFSSSDSDFSRSLTGAKSDGYHLLQTNVFCWKFHFFCFVDTAPSFAQMGVAIQSAIRQSSPDDVTGPSGQASDGDDVTDDVSVSLSDDYQHVLTWCWINIKVTFMDSKCSLPQFVLLL